MSLAVLLCVSCILLFILYVFMSKMNDDDDDDKDDATSLRKNIISNNILIVYTSATIVR